MKHYQKYRKLNLNFIYIVLSRLKQFNRNVVQSFQLQNGLQNLHLIWLH